VTIDVEAAALNFAQEVQDLLDGVLPVPTLVPADDRVVQASTLVGGRRYQVQTATKHGQIVLTKDDQPLAHLRVMFQCTADAAGEYLAIERSDFGLYSIDGRLPIFRLDFRRDMHTAPSCHWNVHAESGPASRLLTLGNPNHPGAFSKLHFPVGGPRMRPCLEDFLGLLLHEFGVDRLPDATTVLCEGRERWRRRQIGTSVRDAPEEAARVLKELGYTVSEPPDGAAPVKVDKLRVW
jgi:hypothetical protein